MPLRGRGRTAAGFHLQFSVGLVGYTVAAGLVAIAILGLIPETRGMVLPSEA